jgi:signal transduction histidine kinase
VVADLRARADKDAFRVARFLRVQRALVRDDEAVLARFARRHPNVSFKVGGREIPPRGRSFVIEGAAPVIFGRKKIATVFFGYARPYVVGQVRDEPLATDDRLLIVPPGTVPAQPANIRLGGNEYRAAAASIRPPPSFQVVAARPKSSVDADVRAAWLTTLGAGLATLATIGLIAWLVAPLVTRGRIAYRERGEAMRILANVRDGVFLADPEGFVRFWNRAAERITGLPRDYVWGRRLSELPGLATVEEEIPVAEDGGLRPQTLPVTLGNRELWLAFAGVAVPEGTVYTFSDVTHEERLEQLKNDFLATVSHELRTPLAGLYGAAVTLRERGRQLPDSIRSELFGTLGEQAERLVHVVEDVLVASGLESHRLLLARNQFDGGAVAREAIEQARHRHATERIELSTDGAAEALGDPTRTTQVLGHLIDNAVKYAPDGQIFVAVERDGKRVVFSVSDEGPGIEPDKQERIFEKFYRSDAQMEGGVGGIGLGLYICRELVSRMGGHLWVESTPGSGSLFLFELPSISAEDVR